MADDKGNITASTKKAQKVKSSTKKGTVLNAVPKYNDNGCCSNCKSGPDIINESICCYLCGDRFHACCREKSGCISSYAICPPSSHKTLMPLIAKYGQTNALRWGHIMFMCNKCEKSVRGLKPPSNSDTTHTGCQTELVTYDSSGTQDIECQTESSGTQDIECQTDLPTQDIECQTEFTDGYADENVVNNILSNDGEPLMKNIGNLLQEMKAQILKDVEGLMDSKLSNSDTINNTSKNISMPNNSVSPQTPVATYASAVSQSSSTGDNSGIAQTVSNDSVVSTHTDDQDHIVVLSTTQQDIVIDDVTKVIDEKLQNVPFSYIKTNSVNKKIILGFPSENDVSKGKDILNECGSLKDKEYSIADAKKMYPKITVSNVPNYLVSHITSRRESMTPNVYRESLKDFLLSKILEKNAYIRECQSGGKVFDIVFVNVGKDYTTLGIKLSPIIRDYLLTNNRIYVGNARCPVFDRFHIKQCFKCQKIGHISSDCREDHIICMYCSASHSTGTCPNKKDKVSHKCRNCAQSKDPSIKALCDTHHSGSQECPTIIREKKRLQERTDYSKNL